MKFLCFSQLSFSFNVSVFSRLSHYIVGEWDTVSMKSHEFDES